MRAVVLVVAAFVEPRLAAEIDAADILRIGRPALVPRKILDYVFRVAMHENDAAAALAVLDEQLPRFGRLHDPAAAGKDPVAAVRRQLHHLGQQRRLGPSETVPASRALYHVRDGRAAPPLELRVEIDEGPTQYLGHPATGCGLACAPHANDEHGAVGPRQICAGVRAARHLFAVQCHLERPRHDIPPPGPRLGHARTLQDEDGAGRHDGQHTEAHGHAVVVVAEDAVGRLGEFPVGPARYLDPILELGAVDAELGKLVLHGQDAVCIP